MRKNPLSNMSTQGGILTSEFLQNFRKGNVNNPRVLPESFVVFGGAAPANKRELDRLISEAWDDLLERWDSISTRYLRMDVSEARTKWIIPLLKALGFDPVYNKQDIAIGESDELKFKLSHKGWDDLRAPMVHTVAPSQDLEERPLEAAGSSRGERRRSPHDELQAYLNLNKITKWGIVTNGILLRVLREFYHTTTKGYVEFDIENIFRERSFTDFKVVFRIAHASRFLQDSEGMCHLEHFYRESIAAGVAVGQNLRKNVKRAIEALGNGFLAPDLADKMVEDEELCKSYYAELLKVIYRMLFLLFAEQRAMLPTRNSLYAEEYSMNRLREIAETRRGKDEHYDLWEGLKVTFHMLKNGCPELKVFGYNGSLFDESEIPILSGLSCKNSDVLTAVRHLTVVEEEGVLKRINYLDLGVEELGSIYESLLDFMPRVPSTEETIEGERIPAKSFFLDPRGAARKTTGSYYTNPLLIDELIKSALKPVVEDRMAKASDKERALLSIKVCDPACGSGAFLIAANNFMARELAKIRTGQAEPPDREVRKARRDVLQHCIYGVDLNPMAIELAKVSLWINSCVEDMPLSFLDHHIKCGNSLVGVSPELLNKGIPDEAFAPIEGDDRDFAKLVKKRNSLERDQKLIDEYKIVPQVVWAMEYASLNDFLETTPDHVEEKKRRYASIVNSSESKSQRLLADAWTSCFFWPLLRNNPQPPTQSTLRMISLHGFNAVSSKTIQLIRELNQKYRYFHWYLEFPDIFERGGFDCVLGNPPWDIIKGNDKEFFAEFDPSFSSLTGVEKEQRKRELLAIDRIAAKHAEATRRRQSSVKFYKNSGRFILQQVNDPSGRDVTQHLNLYNLFLEWNARIVRRGGSIGIVTQAGVIGNQGSQEVRRFLFERMCPAAIYEFTEDCGRECFGVSQAFALTTIFNRPFEGDTRCLLQIKSLADFVETTSKGGPYRIIDWELTKKTSQSLSLACVDSGIETSILKKLYAHPTLSSNDGWGIDLRRELNMTDDRKYIVEHPTSIPLITGEEIGNFVLNNNFQYWVSPEIIHRINTLNLKFRLVLRVVINVNSRRRLISTLVPGEIAMNNSVNYIPRDFSLRDALLLTAFLNSLVLEYRLRQVSKTNDINQYMILQLPVPARLNSDLTMELVSKTFHLVWSSPLLLDRLEDVLREGSVPDARSHKPLEIGSTQWYETTAAIDALVAHAFSLERSELEYILGTFKQLESAEVRKWGSYRTKALVLKYFDQFRHTVQS